MATTTVSSRIVATEKLEGFAAKPQPIEHPLDAILDVVGVLAVQFVLEMVVAVGQPLVLGRIGGGRDLFRHFHRLLLQREQVGQRARASACKVRSGSNSGCCSR